MKTQIKNSQWIDRKLTMLAGITSLIMAGRAFSCSFWLHHSIESELLPNTPTDCLIVWSLWAMCLAVSMLPWYAIKFVAERTVCPGYNGEYLETNEEILGKSAIIPLSIVVIFFLFIFKWSDGRFQIGLIGVFLSLFITIVEAYALLLMDFGIAFVRAMRSYRKVLLTEAEAIRTEGTVGEEVIGAIEEAIGRPALSDKTT